MAHRPNYKRFYWIYWLEIGQGISQWIHVMKVKEKA